MDFKKFLKTADRVIFLFVDNVSAAMVFMIFAIVTMMVIVRYIFKTSSFGFEELPTYFLMVAIWLGAVICSRNPEEGQIRIDVFVNMLKKKPMLHAIVLIVTSCISVSCIAIYTALSWDYVVFCFETNQVTLALRFPMWILTGLTFLACLFLTFYETAILVKGIRHARSVWEGRKAA